jgi:YjbE family integral membrane protein
VSALGSLLDPEFLGRLWAIVLIDLLLAGDNALVIALAVRSLPKRQRFLGRVFGTAGAVMLRVMLIMLATALLRIPLLQATGGVLLLWIAVKLVRPPAVSEAHTQAAGSLARAIRIIIVADAVMSLDNVLGVAGTAQGDMRLVVFGIALSIPIVVWGSGLLGRLMARFTWIVWVGGGLLGYVAGEMILNDGALGRWTGDATLLGAALPPLLGLVMVATGWWYGRVRRPTFTGIRP